MKRLPLLFILTLLVSCGNRTVLDETHQFDNNCWLRFEPEVFQADINNTERGHLITLSLTFDTSILTSAELPLVVDFFADSNELHNFAPSIRLRNRKGELRGETVANFCTVTDTIDRFRTYNQRDTYTYRIKQRTSKYEIYGVSSINLRIEELR